MKTSSTPSVDISLIQKHTVAGPRYTSYPTAVEFSDNFSETKWRQAINNDLRAGSPSLSLYLHIPFCHSLCYFCACTKVIPKDRSGVAAYIASIKKEIEHYRKLLPPTSPVEQIHWGGGTPNYFTPDEINSLHKAYTETFPNWVADADISIEVDPRTTTKEHIRTLADLGFNRISLGVQDFNLNVQERVNRIQTFEETAGLCDDARKAGFRGINIDLIYGLPEQTVNGFNYTIDKLLEIKPNRIALYGYAHVTWLKKVQRTLERSELPSPQVRIAIFLSALERLQAEGYRYIGMDHFALPDDDLSLALDDGRLNRNFMGYTTHYGAWILGLGMSSISSTPSAYAQNIKEIELYQKAIQGGLAIERGIARSNDDKLRAMIIEQILCQGALNVEATESTWGIKFWSYFPEIEAQLAEFASDGILHFSKQQITLTPRGRIFMRNVAMCFDAYLIKHQTEGKRVFSQTL